MFADEFFKFKVIDEGYALAIFLYDHPGYVVRRYEHGAYTYFKYDVNGRLMYRRPSNKRDNGWRIAYGLEDYFRSGVCFLEEI